VPLTHETLRRLRVSGSSWPLAFESDATLRSILHALQQCSDLDAGILWGSLD
jgi:hypothetical protein